MTSVKERKNILQALNKASIMESSLFLTANEQPLTLGQALRYLESAGKLESVLWEIMRSYVIEQELQTLEELDISSELDQVVLDFRLENELTNYASFQEWLANQGLDYPTFRSQIASKFKL